MKKSSTAIRAAYTDGGAEGNDADGQGDERKKKAPTDGEEEKEEGETGGAGSDSSDEDGEDEVRFARVITVPLTPLP